MSNINYGPQVSQLYRQVDRRLLLVDQAGTNTTTAQRNIEGMYQSINTLRDQLRRDPAARKHLPTLNELQQKVRRKELQLRGSIRS